MPDFDDYQPRVGQQDIPYKSPSERSREFSARVTKLREEVEQRMLEMGLLTNSTWLYYEDEEPDNDQPGLLAPDKREILVVRNTIEDEDDGRSYAGIKIFEKHWFKRLQGVDYLGKEVTIDYDGDVFDKTDLIYCSSLKEDGRKGLVGAHPNSDEVGLHYLTPTANLFFWQKAGEVILMSEGTFTNFSPAIEHITPGGARRDIFPFGAYWKAADALYSLGLAEDLWAEVKELVPSDGGSFEENLFD